MRYFKIYNLGERKPFPQKYVTSNGNDHVLYNEIKKIVGDKLAPNGIPLAIEIDSWGELACIGDYYDNDLVAVICISEEKYVGNL